MARINLSDGDVVLGNRVADSQRGVMPTAREFGAGIGQAVEDIGQAAAQSFERLAAEQRALDRQAAAEARQQAREAGRVKALTVTAKVQNGLNALGDEISAGLADGTIDKSQAADTFKQRAGDLMTGGLDGVDAEHRPLVEATLLDNVERARQSVGRMVVARDKADIQQGTASWLEEMQRFAARGGAQANQAIEAVRAYLPSVAARAGLDAQKTEQGFVEKVRFRQAADLVMADPAGAVKNLKDKDWLPELDPDRRAVLLSQAEAAVLRAQERARIEAERLAREQDRVFAGASAVFESGRSFSPEYADQVLARLKGSPYEPALRQMIEAGPANVAAATLPIQQQRAQLDSLIAKANTGGSNPALNAEITRRQKVLAASERDVRDDPLGAALERGVIQTIPPLNLADLGSLPTAIAQRAQVAQVAATWAAQPVSPLRPQEAEQMGQMLRAAPVQQRAAMINALSQATPDGQVLRAMAAQIAGKDQTIANAMVLAADGNKTSAGRTVTELYLRGAEVIATKELKGEAKRELRAAATTRGNMVQAIGEAYFAPQARELYVDAAVKVQAALVAEGGFSDPDGNAVRLVTGGVVTRNGRQVVKPYGWSDREFDDWMTKTRDSLRTSGGEFIAGASRLNGEQLAASLPGARMAAVGAGQYVLVGPGGQIVRRADGSPLVLDAQQ